MAIKKGKKHPKVVNQQELSLIFSRLADAALSIQFKFSKDPTRSRVLEEKEGAIYAGLRSGVLESSGLRTHHLVNVVFYHEGKEFYGAMRILGTGRFNQEEAIRLKIPEFLYIRDDFGLTSLNVSPRKDVTFTNMFGQFCSGKLVNIGSEGVDIVSKESIPSKELIKIDRECDIAFDLDSDLKIYNRARILYINNVGEELIGIRFHKLDKATNKGISNWIRDQILIKKENDNAFMCEHLAGKRELQDSPLESISFEGLRLEDDLKTVVHEGSEYVLLLCRDDNMIVRIGNGLKRKFGVLVSKGRFTNVKLIIDYYKPKLVLIFEKLGPISGYDLVTTIKNQMLDAPHMVVIGTGKEDECRRLALLRGALDFWSVDPFRPLAFFKLVQESMADPDQDIAATVRIR